MSDGIDELTRDQNETALTRRQALTRSLAGLAALAALAVPGAAIANGRDDHRGHGRGHDGHRGRGRGHDDHRRRRRRRREHRHEHHPVWRGGYGWRRGFGYAATPAFFCAPCGHRFGRRQDFHSHLHHHHGIPLWRIPGLIVQAAFGWIFYGY